MVHYNSINSYSRYNVSAQKNKRDQQSKVFTETRTIYSEKFRSFPQF